MSILRTELFRAPAITISANRAHSNYRGSQNSIFFSTPTHLSLTYFIRFRSQNYTKIFNYKKIFIISIILLLLHKPIVQAWRGSSTRRGPIAPAMFSKNYAVANYRPITSHVTPHFTFENPPLKPDSTSIWGRIQGYPRVVIFKQPTHPPNTSIFGHQSVTDIQIYSTGLGGQVLGVAQNTIVGNHILYFN